MTKLIQFPGSTATGNVKFKKVEPVITRLPDEKLVLEPINFTCIHCHTTAKINMENMIFKHAEFYCSCCGSLYKISNPAFGRKHNPPK